MTSRSWMSALLMFCLVLGLCTGPMVMKAQAADLESMDLSQIMFTPIEKLKVVSATRYEQSVMSAPSAISVITQSDIQYSAARSVPELLQYVVGLDGYIKTQTDMDFGARGYAFDEVSKMLVLIDGQPVNVVPYSGMQWPTVPIRLNQIERIEIVRGPASSVYGADALVGVINIITKTAAQRKTGVAALVGEHQRQEYDGYASKALNDKWSLALGIAYFQPWQKGDAETAQATKVAPNWDIKDWSSMSMGTYRLDYKDDTDSFLSEGGISLGFEGYNPSPGDADINKTQKRTIFMNNRYTRSYGEDSLNVRVGVRDLRQENWKFSGGEYVPKYLIGKGLGIDTDVQYTMTGIKNNTLVFGANASQLQARRDIYNVPVYVYDEKDDLWALYAQDQLSLLDNRMVLTLGGRYDKWTTLEGAFTPKVAVNYALKKDVLDVRASYGTAFRRPGFDENFYFVNFGIGWFKGSNLTLADQDGTIVQGSLLKPEKLTSYEAGLRWMPADNPVLSWLDLTLFNQKVSDFVGYSTYLFRTDAGGNLQAYNFGFSQTGQEVTTNGVELELKKYFSSKFSAFVNYTYQDAVSQLGGVSSAYLGAPKNKINGGITYATIVNVDLRARYNSDVTYSEAANTLVPGYTTVDLALSKAFMQDRLFVKLAARNLLNNIHYEYPLYTQLVREAFLSASYNF